MKVASKRFEHVNFSGDKRAKVHATMVVDRLPAQTGESAGFATFVDFRKGVPLMANES